MSQEIVRPIVRRIREREQKAITALAVKHAVVDAQTEAVTSDSTLLQQRSTNLAGMMFELHKTQSHRGQIARFLHRNEPAITYGARLEVFKQKSHNHQGYESKPFVVRYGELKSPLLKIETADEEELRFNIGWQIVLRKEISRRGWSAAPNSYLSNPMRIEWVAVEVNTGVYNEDLAYQVDMASGDVSSYTDGNRDDRLLTVGKQAGSHALALINQTITLLDC